MLVGGAYWAGTKATSPSALGKQYTPAPPTELTVPIVLRRLSETLLVQGTVAAAGGYPVNFGPVNVPDAQPIVTARPLGRGTQVANGALLAQVAGRPVFAMLGSTPMYRDLAIGDRGSDVAQLQDDLAALGFHSYDSRGFFGNSTLRAARAFFGSSGYPLPQPTATPGPSTTAPPSPASTVVVPQAEVIFISTLPAIIQSSSLKLGMPVTNPALTLNTNGLEVLAPLTGAQASVVQPKDAVTVVITSAGGAVTSVAATVATIQTAIQNSQSGSVAVLRPSRPLAWSLAGDQADGTITIASTSNAVLAVPVAALYTAGAGQTFVTTLGPHGKRTNVQVKVGAEIGGYVPVQPAHGRLRAGENVLVGQ